MLFGNKKKKGPVEVKLGEKQFCVVLEEKSEDVASSYCVIASSDNYNLLYRDGRFLGMPAPYGGAIYPFSNDPTKQGSNGQKKNYRSAKIVCLSKDFNLKVNWGTPVPYRVFDESTGKTYDIGARGVFYVNIDPTDAARKADMFYSKVLTQRDAAAFDTDALRGFLADAFTSPIGAIIEKYLHEQGRPINAFAGLQPSEILAVSKDICPNAKDIFAEYGITIVEKASENSILQALVVKEVVTN